MASTVNVTLVGPKVAVRMTVSATDDQFNTLKDTANSLNLYEVVAPGTVIHGGNGMTAVGGGIIRVRNTASGVTKALFCTQQVNSSTIEYFTRPFRVEYGDIAEVYLTAAGS